MHNRPRSARLALGCWTIEVAFLGELNLESVGRVFGLLGAAKDQVAVGRHCAMDVAQGRLSLLVGEVQKHIAHEDEIKDRERRHGDGEIRLAEGAQGADSRVDRPFVSAAGEVLEQHLRGEAAIDLEASVAGAFGVGKHIVRDVGGDDLDVPVVEFGEVLADKDGEGVGLLAGGGGGAPEAQTLRGATCFDEGRKDGGADGGKWLTVTEEAGFVDRQRFGRGAVEGRWPIRPEEVADFVQVRCSDEAGDRVRTRRSGRCRRGSSACSEQGRDPARRLLLALADGR